MGYLPPGYVEIWTEATYKEVCDLLAKKYGKDIIKATVAETLDNPAFLKYLKSTANIRPMLSKSGKMIGFEKIVQVRDAFGIGGSKVVTASSAFGTTASSTGTVTATGVGSGTAAGTAGSFTLGTAGAAAIGVGVGAVVGLGIDQALYNSNPKYWDEVCPYYNVKAWDDMILGRDSKIPFLHNTVDGSSYISEETAAYMIQFLDSQNAFAGTESISSGELFSKTFTIIPLKGTILIYNTDSLNIYLEIEDSYPDNKYYLYKGPDNLESYLRVASIHAGSTPKIFYHEIPKEGGKEVRYELSFNYLGNYIFNNKEAFISSSTQSLYSNIDGIASGPLPLKQEEELQMGWTSLYGVITKVPGKEGLIPSGKKTPSNGSFKDLSVAEAIAKMNSDFPDWLNRSVSMPVVDPNTGENHDRRWLPITFPYEGTKDNPLSDGWPSLDPGLYPSNKDKDKAIEDTIYPGIDGNINTFPPNIPPESEDTPPVVPPSTSGNNGMGAVYIPTLAQLKEFNTWLWSPSFIDQIAKLFNNPMEGIVGLHQIYCTPVNSGNAGIQVGYLNSGVNSAYTEERYITVDCGKVSLSEHFGNVLDYSPYTNISIYLPFIGFVSLSCEDCMNADISVKYICDVLSGACICNIEISKDYDKTVMYSYGGSCTASYPLSSGSYIGMVGAVAGAIAGVAGAVATGGAAAIPMLAGAAGSAMSGRTNVTQSGGYSGNTGAMAFKKPYLLVRRKNSAMPYQYEKYEGRPLENTVDLGNTKGFVKISKIFIDGNMLKEERNQIERLMMEGVII